MCFFFLMCVCVYCLRAGTLTVKDTDFNFGSISVTGAREPTDKHDGALNQAGASDEEAERKEERENFKPVSSCCVFLACRR